MKPRIYMHLPAPMFRKHGGGGFGLFSAVKPSLEAMGFTVEILQSLSSTELVTYDDEAFHLVYQGFLQRHNVLNCGASYMGPYWYIDRRGVLSDSLIARTRFNYRKSDFNTAAHFFARLRRSILPRGLSRRAQPPRTRNIGKGRIVVFLQGATDRLHRNQHMAETDMLDIVLRYRGQREVLIKKHPYYRNTPAARYADQLAHDYAGVHVVSANVHDMLAGAYCSVSINSGASFEGLLHYTPAVLFGISDFRACAATVKNQAEAREALLTIRDRGFRYEQFVYWFLCRKLQNLRSLTLAEDVLLSMLCTGFEFRGFDISRQIRPRKGPVDSL